MPTNIPNVPPNIRLKRRTPMVCAKEYWEKHSTKFIVPWCPSLYPSVTFGGSHRVPTDFWPVVRPCVLSLPRPASTSAHVSVPVFYVSLSWMQVFQQAYRTHDSSSDVRRLLWLLGFPNGLIYQFRLSKQSAPDYAPLFSLTAYEPVASWVSFNIPTGADSMAVADPDTNEIMLLVAVGYGHLGGQQSSGERMRLLDLLCGPDLPEPEPPRSPIVSLKQADMIVNCLSDAHHHVNTSMAVLRLFGYPADGQPCEAGHRLREPIKDRLNVDVYLTSDPEVRTPPCLFGLVVLVDVKVNGHLGGQQSSGERMRLLDLLCGPDLPEPEPPRSPIVSLKQADMIVNCLSDAHHHVNTSMAVLRLFGYPADGQPCEAGHRLREPIKDRLNVDVYLTSDPEVRTPPCLFGLVVLVDVKLVSPPVDETVTCLDSLTPEQLASYLLSPDSNASRSTFPDLRLTVRLSPVSHITKSHLTTSQMRDSHNSSSIPSGQQSNLYFLPTSQVVTLCWTPFVQSDLAGDKYATGLFANSFKVTLSSSCFRTLWSVHLAMEERLRTQSGAHMVDDNSQSTTVTVEDLRVEYGLLKALEHSLQSLRLKKPQCDESEKQSAVANLLSAFCTVRNSIASSWLFS
ncbi:hypothetical protein AHF37_03042 [Paragonimus kellicotti]|nr:hypothetical protein AHF37_03042 [Paragonimus kellicotti]